MQLLYAELTLKIVTGTQTASTNGCLTAGDIKNAPLKEEKLVAAELEPSPDSCHTDKQVTESDDDLKTVATVSQPPPGGQCEDCRAIWPDDAAPGCLQADRECLGQLVKKLARRNDYWEGLLARRESGISSSNYCAVCRRLLDSRKGFLHHVRQQHLPSGGRRGKHAAAKSLAEVEASAERAGGSAQKESVAAIQQFSATEMRYYSVVITLPPAGRFSCQECGIHAMEVSDFAKHVKLIHLGLDVWAALDPR